MSGLRPVSFVKIQCVNPWSIDVLSKTQAEPDENCREERAPSRLRDRLCDPG